jgi:hypothetical protein
VLCRCCGARSSAHHFNLRVRVCHWQRAAKATWRAWAWMQMVCWAWMQMVWSSSGLPTVARSRVWRGARRPSWSLVSLSCLLALVSLSCLLALVSLSCLLAIACHRAVLPTVVVAVVTVVTEVMTPLPFPRPLPCRRKAAHGNVRQCAAPMCGNVLQRTANACKDEP